MTGKIETIYKLSPLQEGLLFHALLEPESDPYVVQFSATLRGGVDPARLQEAWRRVTARHGMLRTSFHWKEVEKPVQVVHTDVALPWTDTDEPCTGFALDRAPLFRLSLVRIGEGKYRFTWTLHHLILDGWSLHVVLREVFALYRDLDASLPEPRPFADYLKWLKQRRTGFSPSGGGLKPALRLPARREAHLQISEGLGGALERLARGSGVTLNTVVSGAWSLLLSMRGGEDDIVFGSVVSGRPAEIRGIESMVGMFINTLPIEVNAGAEQSVAEWLQSLQRTMTEARQYEHVPLAGRTPFDSIVIFENYPMEPSLFGSIAGLEIADIRVSERTTYPFALTIIPGPPLRFRLLGDDDAERMLERLEHLLTELTVRESMREIELVTDAERERIVADWNGTARDFGPPATIHALFEEQAARTPDAVAIRVGARTMTFRELDERATEAARAFEPGTLVPLSMKRSPEMIVALLGILKAGAAYVPIDPTSP